MKNINFKKLALKGVATAVLTTAALNAASAVPTPSSSKGGSLLKEMENADGGNLGYHLYSEDDLKLELTPEGLKLYNSLSPEGKRLARVVASSRCDHQNACKGLGACKTDDHECAGKNECKGQGKCSLSDKNLAVKLVADKMSKKRNEVIQKK